MTDMSNNIDFDSLLLLTKAKSESDIQLICDDYIDVQSVTISVPQFVVNKTRQLLDNSSIDDNSIRSLITNLSKLVYLCLKSTDLSDNSLNALFPQTFHKQLKQLLIKLIVKNSDKWIAKSRPIQSMPSLVDFECRTESNKCVIDLQLTDPKDKVSVVLSKQQLKEMTEGMATIRQQLFDATHKSN
ncbi:unnamed protein product [Medioppia subpectinata]|uniref:COMMD9 N-terminal domain-containing protein n=1 Tax=Medioppia subpectinata TaxID=1979941 RepID=A0A7R9LDY8_9ACAR|nr:unnamed protein product [Medioppia subpectinata]CAG2117676.1 unnamed protein product [Medioppia subpectinata]